MAICSSSRAWRTEAVVHSMSEGQTGDWARVLEGAEHPSSSFATWLIRVLMRIAPHQPKIVGGSLVICSATAYHLPSRFVHLMQSSGGHDAARYGVDQC
jgi:hypothetical protein